MPNVTCSIPVVPFNKTKMLSAMRKKGILSIRALCGSHDFHRNYVTICQYFREERMPLDILKEISCFLEDNPGGAHGELSVYCQTPALIECYPANALAAALGLSKDDPEANVRLAGYDLRPMYDLAFLTERERQVISYRFLDKMSLSEVASVFGVGKERIRQIEAKALRKIRSRREKWAIYHKEDVYDNVKQALEEIKAAVSGEEAKPSIHSAGIEILDLSVRAYNCLHRAGIRTIQELIQFDKNQSLEYLNGRQRRCWIGIRNMGVRTYQEVHDRVLDRIGYEIHKDFMVLEEE